ncbi:hypothetical protein ABTG52_07650, partial [Acinetobacter baumannii]
PNLLLFTILNPNSRPKSNKRDREQQLLQILNMSSSRNPNVAKNSSANGGEKSADNNSSTRRRFIR